MAVINFDAMLLEGCAVRQRLNWRCNDKTPWSAIVSHFKEAAKPFSVTGFKYSDSDGDMVTIENSNDFNEAVKDGLKTNGLVSLSFLVDVEKTGEQQEKSTRKTSEASVSTCSSYSFSEPFDLTSFKKEIIESVLGELRSEQIENNSNNNKQKKGKKGRGRGCVVVNCSCCNLGIDVFKSIYYKCANCAGYFLCRTCEEANNHGHCENHVFLKLKAPLKLQFANKVLIKNFIQKNVVQPSTSHQSVATGTDLTSFCDSLPPASSIGTEVGRPSRPRSGSESTYASIENDEHSTAAVVSNGEDEDDEDFLVVPMPACFNLEQPLVPVPLSQMSSVSASNIVPPVNKKDDKHALEAAVQHDLDYLAQSMEMDEKTAPESIPPPPAPVKPLPPPSQSATAVEPHDLPVSAVPSALLHQAASVGDQSPVNLASITQRNTPMDKLMEMGFGDRRVNNELLDKYQGNVELVVADLIARESWDFYQ